MENEENWKLVSISQSYVENSGTKADCLWPPSRYARFPFSTGVKKYIQNYQRWHCVLSS